MIKHTLWVAALALATTAACKDDSGLTGDDVADVDAAPQPDAPPGITFVDVAAGDITTDTTWTKNTVYTLKGYVFVVGSTLTIEPGTVIKGDAGSALTITSTGRIVAAGTAAEPIVFTSSNSMPMSGDWGGLVMLGQAPINVTGGSNQIEGFPTSLGDRVRYGGTAATHDCGTLRYVRIEYAGFELAPGNELNGLTLGACGSGTTVSYVQSHLGLDDGIEVFGGAVKLDHLVITQPDDDGLDWDLGWTGRAQFVVVQQKAGRGDKGIEADNHPTVFSATPRSAPELWNVTLVGGDGPTTDKRQGGLHLRRGTAVKLSNAIVAYWNQFGLDVDGLDSVGQVGAALTVQHTYFVKSTSATAVWPADFDRIKVSSNPDVFSQNDCQSPSMNCLVEETVFGAAATNHVDIDVQLGAPKDLAAPNWRPATGSPALAGCATPPSGLDTTATYCGAFGATDWTAGWARFGN